MREACLYNNWSFVPVFLKICRALMRWTPWSLLGRWRWWVPTMGHSPRMRSGGSGDESSLQNSIGWEFTLFIKTHFYGGSLTSHFMEEHSSPTSIYPVFMMTSSNGNMFRVTGFCAGNSPVTAEISSATGELPSHRPVTRSFDVFFDLRLNKRLGKQSSRRWFETPSFIMSGTKRKYFAVLSSQRPCWRWLQLQPSCGSPQGHAVTSTLWSSEFMNARATVWSK